MADAVSLVYWRWRYSGTLSHLGSLSHLHKTHPRYDNLTWCGALCSVESGAGIAQVYKVGERPNNVIMCQVCTSMANPMIVDGWDPPELREERRRLAEANRKIREEKEAVERAAAERILAEKQQHRDALLAIHRDIAEEREAEQMAYRLEHLLKGIEWDRAILGLCPMCGADLEQPLNETTQRRVYCSEKCHREAISRAVRMYRGRKRQESAREVAAKRKHEQAEAA